MMSNKRYISLLPRMAVSNIRKNTTTYLPYIGISTFAMFTYFVFDLILKTSKINFRFPILFKKTTNICIKPLGEKLGKNFSKKFQRIHKCSKIHFPNFY